MIGHYIYLINCLAHDWMDKDVTRHMTEWSKMWPDTWLNGQRCDLTHDWMVKDVTWHMTEWSKMWPDTWLNGQRCDLTQNVVRCKCFIKSKIQQTSNVSYCLHSCILLKWIPKFSYNWILELFWQCCFFPILLWYLNYTTL